ncbi:MAG: DMT family transporter [Burkholderiales bacterium]|jgi:drug/metabolite transporter (DMT)-like permease|nr:carboxylate/amino acid/amine transporter [Betaproteobacteria bacterium MOLA814]|tara:strand:- start:79 stop:984 length:906 start_codon:yes stop_codon:yes gene_type:complete
MTHSQRAISGAAFLTLLTIALMMGANHVAARFAFDSGVDVVTAIAFRSVLTAFVIALIVWQQRVPLMLTRQQQRHLPVIGLLIAVQSFCLYSAVARLPVVLALLAFNTYPISTALWARLLYKQRPQREVLLVIPFILLGLALALDVLGAASGLSASAHWLDIGSGVAFAFAASLTFGLCLVITENETRGLDGRLRTLSTLGIVGLLAVAAALSGDGFQLPNASPGWWGLMLLTFLYGTAFTVMFTVLPKLGVVGNSAIMNVEPVFALLLAWALLGQTIAPMQVGGASLVVVSVMWLGLRKG